MTDFILKHDFTYPAWKITLDHDYIGIVNLQDPYRASYLVTDFTLKDEYFNIKIMDNDQKHVYKFNLPDPMVTNRTLALAEVAKYKIKKYKPWKSKVLVDLRYLSMSPSHTPKLAKTF